jgi:hypothetical protein
LAGAPRLNFVKSSLWVFWEGFVFFAAITLVRVVVFTFFEFMEVKGGGGSIALFEAIIALFTYQSLLKGVIMPRDAPMPVWSLTFRVLGLIFAALVLSLAVLATLLPMKAGPTAFLIVFTIYCFMQTLMLSLFGTVLPAIVDEGDKSWKAAWRRGRQTWAGVMWRIFAGPGLVIVASLSLALILGGEGEFASDGVIRWRTIVLSFPFMLIATFSSVMTHVIVAGAYMRTQSRPTVMIR